MTLQERVSSIVEKGLSDFPVPRIRDDKIFHDPLRGTQRLYMHEVGLVDTIFMQRLKRVHQTGFAYQVYPTATHTRFEHSLGTLFFAARMFDSLSKQYSTLCGPRTLRTIRMAALLHDIGSLPFSHSSELFVSTFDEFSELKRNPKFANCKVHEIISFLILNSKPFQDFLQDDIAKKYMIDFDGKMIPQLVIGSVENPKIDKFQADIINGTFDSDKLDYLTRDSYYTGLPMSVDIDRLMQSLTLPTEGELDQMRLMVDIKGVPCLEQVLFNKIYLFSTVYHHHKIRAIECMFTNMYDLAFAENRKFDENILHYDDCSVFGYFYERAPGNQKKLMKTLISSIVNRRLFMRSLVFSPQSLNEKTRANLESLTKKTEKPRKIFEIRNELSKGVGCEPYEIAIDLPPIPYVREVTHELVRVGPKKISTLKALYPIDEWLRSYSNNKWKGHVFSFEKHRKKAAEVAEELLKSKEYGIELNEYSVDFAKYP